jgi:putative membrane protein
MIREPMLAIGVAAALALTAGAALAQTPNAGGASNMNRPQTSSPAHGDSVSKPDQKFLTDAIQGDLAEVQMGQLAQQKGSTEGVKELGATLVKDHGEHADKIRQLGESLGVTLPSVPNATQKSDHAKMSIQSGQQFDRQFALRMVNEHMKDISKYQMEAKQRGPIADMAKETLPMLQKHLEMAQALNRSGPITGSR